MAKAVDFCVSAALVKTDECVIWPFGCSKVGYGLVHKDGKHQGAHRVVCRLAHGDPPTPKHEAAHSCRNRNCVNPNHLSWKTSKENKADTFRDGTHNRGERQGASKLKEAQVAELLNNLENRVETRVEIATRLNISVGTVDAIRTGERWAHVSGPRSIGNRCGSKHKSAKVNEAQVLEIRALHKAGITPKILSEKFQLSISAIRGITSRRKWRHI